MDSGDSVLQEANGLFALVLWFLSSEEKNLSSHFIIMFTVILSLNTIKYSLGN